MPTCSVCNREFEERFRFQVALVDGVTRHFCSQMCRVRAEASATGDVVCSTCGRRFRPEFVYQTMSTPEGARYFCGSECRTPAVDAERRAADPVRRIAVLNQKGGTGKTTTAVNLAAGLAERGFRTLVVDVDVQGSVAVALGLKPTTAGLAGLLGAHSKPLVECIEPARENLDVLAGGAALETIQTSLARTEGPGRHLLLRERLGDLEGYDYVLVDCGPSRSPLNRSALHFVDEVLVPVACDYLSLVGVRHILATLKEIQATAAHPVSVLGVLPTFFDVRTRISHEVVRTLRRSFRDLILPPIRVNARLKEAPAQGRSIFECDRRSRGAADYRELVRAIVSRQWDSSPLDRLRPRRTAGVPDLV